MSDIIILSVGDRLFEIKYVEHEKPFYQLKNTYVYELRCELFRYEDEVIDTGVDEIDDTLEAVEGADGEDVLIGSGGTQKLTLAGVSVQATAVTGVINGGYVFDIQFRPGTTFSRYIFFFNNNGSISNSYRIQGGKNSKKTKKTKKTKNVRKHRGIIQTGGNKGNFAVLFLISKI